MIMIGVEAILMFFLELTLVMVTLCLLLRLRNSVGTSSFTILIGALIIFGEFMMAGRVGLKSGNIHGHQSRISENMSMCIMGSYLSQ